jgi:hypothetical protein
MTSNQEKYVVVRWRDILAHNGFRSFSDFWNREKRAVWRDHLHRFLARMGGSNVA